MDTLKASLKCACMCNNLHLLSNDLGNYSLTKICIWIRLDYIDLYSVNIVHISWNQIITIQQTKFLLE